MPEVAEAPAPTSKPEAAPKLEKLAAQERDVKQVTQKLFREKVPEKPTAEQAGANPTATIIASSEYFGNLNKKQIGDGIEFPDGTTGEGKMEGNPVFLTVNGEQVRLVSISADQADDVDTSDELTCKFESPDGMIEHPEDKIPRQQIVEANLVAERTAIEDGFSGDEKEVIKAYLDAIDPNVSAEDKSMPSDDVLKNVADQHDMMTMDETKAVVDLLAKDNPIVQNALKALEDRNVLGADEFNDLIKDVATPEVIEEQQQKIEQSITDSKAQLDALPADADEADKKALEQQWKDAMAQRRVLNKTEEAIQAYSEDITAEGTAEQNKSHVDREITHQISELDHIINNAEQYDDNVIKHAQRVHAELALAQIAKGEAGAFQKYSALLNAKDAYENHLPGTIPVGVEDMLTDKVFLTEVATATESIQQTLGLSHEDAAKLGEEGGLEALLQKRPDLEVDTDELYTKLYGDMDRTIVNALKTNVNDTIQDINDGKWQNRLKDYLRENPRKRAGIALLILAAIPVVIAGATAAAAIGAATTGATAIKQAAR